MAKLGKLAKAETNKYRQAVYERDQHRCIVTGDIVQNFDPCNGELTIQHAVARGMGSSAKYSNVDALRAMCAFHNLLDTSSATFHKWALRNGWSVHRWMADRYGLDNIPVKYADGWFLLVGGQRLPVRDDIALEVVQQLHGPDFDTTFEGIRN